MKTANETLETVEIGKYIFQIYDRSNAGYMKNRPYGVLYAKKTPKARVSKTRVIQNVAFESIERCEKYIEDLYRKIYLNMKSDQEYKEKKRLEQKEVVASDFYKVGDIVVNSWGYEQTNIEFYQVVKVTARTIMVKEIGQNMVEDSMYAHGMAWKVVADKDNFVENGDEYKLRVYARGALSKPESYYHFTKWDGSPEYKSTYY